MYTILVSDLHESAVIFPWYKRKYIPLLNDKLTVRKEKQ